jgi:hypothetical protein
MTIQPTHLDLSHVLEQVLTKLGAVEAKVEANGEQAREGFERVDKRLEVIEAKVHAYDLLKARVLAGVSVATVTIGAAFAAFWWAVGDKIAHFVRGPTP